MTQRRRYLWVSEDLMKYCFMQIGSLNPRSWTLWHTKNVEILDIQEFGQLARWSRDVICGSPWILWNIIFMAFSKVKFLNVYEILWTCGIALKKHRILAFQASKGSHIFKGRNLYDAACLQAPTVSLVDSHKSMVSLSYTRQLGQRMAITPTWILWI